MKHFYIPFLLLTILCSSNYAQNITYDLQCSTDGNSYEIYVTRDLTSSPLFAGSSVITLVLPTGNSRTVSHTSESVSTYNAITPIIDGNSTGNDFYPFQSGGGSSISNILTEDTPVLWLTLTPSDGTNQDARLFINGSDPNDIGGVSPFNRFSTLAPLSGIVDEYDSNVSDAAINCSTLSTTELVKANNTFSIYPNPTNTVINIKGFTNNTIEVLNVIDINGRLVLKSEIKAQLNVSELNDGVYFLEIQTKTGKQNLRFIKY